MWGKHSKRFRSAKIDTLLGEGTALVGDVHYTGGLHVDGQIQGNVVVADEDDSSSMLILSEHGRIEGEVRVPNLLINGEVAGDVYSSGHVELASRARLTGNLYYNKLEMAVGAEINGQMVHVDPKTKPLLTHHRDEPPEEPEAEFHDHMAQPGKT